MTLPPLPPWEGFHVLVVHFPIALLLVAPLLMLGAMFVQRRLPGVGASAWIVMCLGTIAMWVAVYTGMAAYDVTSGLSDAAIEVMNNHKDMGELMRNVFNGLCAAYGLVLGVPVLFKRIKAGTWRVAGTLIVLAVYAWAAICLINTAHEGGRLVHQFGVRASVAESIAIPAAPAK